MNDTVPLVWTDEELLLTPDELLTYTLTGTQQSRLDAYRKSEAKFWYERIVLATTVFLDVNQIASDIAREVVHLRSLVGTQPPWKVKETT